MRKLIHSSLSTALSAALVMLIGLSGVSSTALAVAPSNSPLSITVTVTHSEDTAGTEAGRVYFEVNLSPAPLMLIAEPPSQSVLEGDPITYNYTAISTANGPDSYTLIVQPSGQTNVDGNIGSFVVTPNTLSLGATAASGPVAAGTLEIPVLSDGVADNSINGIEADDTVYIHGQAHTVDVVEDQPLEETSVIHLTEAHDTAISVGDMISEAKTFELAIDGVAILDAAEDALVGMTVTGTSDTDTAAVAMHDTQTIVFAPIPASTEYWVRNVTNPNGEGDAGYATADQSYYGTGGQVKASAGDELEYIIVQSAGNTGDLNDVVIRSTMPLFTTYIGNSTYLNGQEQADPPADPAESALIAGLDAGTIVRNGAANVTFRVLVDAIPESDQGGQTQGQVTAPSSVVVDNAYGDAGSGRLYYRVTSLSIDQAAKPGTYTFFSLVPDSAAPASVDLKLNGVIVDTLTYNWQTTVGAGNVYTFDFPGYLQLSVTKDGSGTMNLYNMPESIFNDVETVVVR